MNRKLWLLKGIIQELTTLIRRDEGAFAELVLGDFRDALAISPDRYKTAYQWLHDYRQMTY